MYLWSWWQNSNHLYITNSSRCPSSPILQKCAPRKMRIVNCNNFQKKDQKEDFSSWVLDNYYVSHDDGFQVDLCIFCFCFWHNENSLQGPLNIKITSMKTLIPSCLHPKLWWSCLLKWIPPIHVLFTTCISCELQYFIRACIGVGIVWFDKSQGTWRVSI